MLVLSVIGLGVAAYLTIVHYAGLKPACTAGQSCIKVQTSQWSKLDGVPVALLGLIGYIGIVGSLLVLAVAHAYAPLLIGAMLIGMGSSVFHPEASRVARMASGGRYGVAQSLFQVGGNVGSALGPLAAALVVVRWGQSSLTFFALLALLSGAILWNVGLWYRHHGLARLSAKGSRGAAKVSVTAAQARSGIVILLVLIFSKYMYLTSLNSYFTFYLIDRFGLSVRSAQLHLFVFLAAIAVGTVIGGPLGDRIGRKLVIRFSILGALPFTLLLPYASLFWTTPLIVAIGLIVAAAFPAIVVFAQELMPGRVGMVAGLFFGFAFGVAGVGAALLGLLADHTSIETVYRVCSVIPAFGLLAMLLPDLKQPAA